MFPSVSCDRFCRKQADGNMAAEGNDYLRSHLHDVVTISADSPFSSNKHHRSNADRLEGKRENYQVYSVQYCVQQYTNDARLQVEHSNMLSRG